MTGNGTYEVFIKKITNNEKIYKDIKDETLKEWKANAKQKDDIDYKMALAGFYMKDDFKATTYYQRAGSIEAKLCLGYMHSIGKLHYDTTKAEELFKESQKQIKKQLELQ